MHRGRGDRALGREKGPPLVTVRPPASQRCRWVTSSTTSGDSRVPRRRLRLRSRFGRRIRPVRERRPDGQGAGRPVQDTRTRSGGRKGGNCPRPIPARLFEAGLRWFRDDPHTERFFAVRWGRRRLPRGGSPAEGTASRLEYRTPGGRGGRVPLARIPARLLLENRRPGRAGVPHLRRRQDAWTRPNRN